MRLALYEPDIPQNTGAIARLSACLGVGMDVIEPCGFTFSDAGFRRAGMDYVQRAEIARHASWDDFRASLTGKLVLLSTRASLAYTQFDFSETDTLLFGSESAGVPDHVHEAASTRLRIPMRPDARSLNVALAAAMVLGEAIRQTNRFPA